MGHFLPSGFIQFKRDMRIFKWRSQLFFFLVLVSCNSAPKLENFDSDVWASDRYGCRGQRSQFYSSLKLQKSKLLGLNEMEVVRVLGNPDQNELYTRNQKFYYYFLEPSEKCSNPTPSAKRLVLRFNAVGLLKEVSEQ
jgi:outer membrane protein assembly factor BamE (lipoprotein component of BamABCDE complex)